METTNDYITEVCNGAAWLDATNPGWEHKIDLGQLKLDNTCKCVLGWVVANGEHIENMQQFFRYNWDTGYGIVADSIGYDETWLADHGFKVDNDFYSELDLEGGAGTKEYAKLTETWLMVLKARYDLGIFSDTPDF